MGGRTGGAGGAEDPVAAVEVLERDLDLVTAVQDLGRDLESDERYRGHSSMPGPNPMRALRRSCRVTE